MNEGFLAGKEHLKFDFNRNFHDNLRNTKLRLDQSQCCVTIKKKIYHFSRVAHMLMLNRCYKQEDKFVMGAKIYCLVPAVFSFTHIETGQESLFISANIRVEHRASGPSF